MLLLGAFAKVVYNQMALKGKSIKLRRVKIVLMLSGLFGERDPGAPFHNDRAVSRPVRHSPDFPERRPFCAIAFREVDIVIFRFFQDYKK